MKSTKKLNQGTHPQQQPKRKRFKAKNLSPAKKFRLGLRRARMQKQKQAKEEYYEHDTRAIGQQKNGKLNKKKRLAQMYVEAYLKNHQNGDTASQDETQDSSNGNCCDSLKSVVHTSGQSLMTSQYDGHIYMNNQASKNNNNKMPLAPPISYPTTHFIRTGKGNTSTAIKCCCHCACPGAQRKARRKLSSPYIGEFNRPVDFAGSSCAKAELTTNILNKTTTTTHHHHQTLLKGDSDDLLDYRMSVNYPSNYHHQLVPALDRSFRLQGRAGGSGVREMRSVIRFVR